MLLNIVVLPATLVLALGVICTSHSDTDFTDQIVGDDIFKYCMITLLSYIIFAQKTTISKIVTSYSNSDNDNIINIY